MSKRNTTKKRSKPTDTGSIIFDMFNDRFFDDDFKNLKMKPDVKKLLHSYQHMHVFNMISALKKYDSAIDGSSTGTGKTYTSVAICKQLGLTPIIICPKINQNSWKSVCNRFEVVPECIVNYELLRTGKIYDDNDKKIEAPFIKKCDKGKYEWSIKDKNRKILIYDEAHKCKNKNSQLGKLMMSSKHKCKILLLSATLCDKINDFMLFGYVLGIYAKLSTGRNWLKWTVEQDIKNIDQDGQSTLYKNIFPKHGSKMDIDEVNFPDNIIIAECYDIDPKDRKKMNNRLEKLKNKRSKKLKNKCKEKHRVKFTEDTDTSIDINNDNKPNKKNSNKSCVLEEMTDERQEIEKIKVPIILEEITKSFNSGKSVVVFVNFVKSVETLSICLDKLEIKHCIIKGGQDKKERDENIELFQYNRRKVIVCTIQSGGDCISLHDKFGGHPRISLISPSLKAIEITQALGRIKRSGGKSKCIQKLIFCAGTLEERIAKIIKEKSKFINNLTDDDLFNY